MANFLKKAIKALCSGPCQEEKRKFPGDAYKPLRDAAKRERHNPKREPKARS